MKQELCDRCKTKVNISHGEPEDWTDVEFKGRRGAVTHISRSTYCPNCLNHLKEVITEFNNPPMVA